MAGAGDLNAPQQLQAHSWHLDFIAIGKVRLFASTHSGMGTVKVKNWNKFQHFKDRRPPWIKIHREILDDPDWHDLDGEAAKALIGLWLIASEDPSMSGELPDTRKLTFRLRISEAKLNQLLAKLDHWLDQYDIGAISERYRADDPETETETETERVGSRKRSPRQTATRIPDDFDLTPERRQVAEAERLDPGRTFAKFRDYWLAASGANARKHDWDATWRNWCRREGDHAKANPKTAPAPVRPPPKPEEIAAARSEAARANQLELARKMGGVLKAVQ